PVLWHEAKLGHVLENTVVTSPHVDCDERTLAAACHVVAPSIDEMRVPARQLEHAPEQWPVLAPTLRHLLEVAPQVNVNRRLVPVPQQAIVVIEPVERHLREIEACTGRIMETE